MKKLDLNIKGMHCNSCVMLINDALSETKGVSSSKVDLKTNSAKIEYDDKLITDKQIISIIDKEGYKASLKK